MLYFKHEVCYNLNMHFGPPRGIDPSTHHTMSMHSPAPVDQCPNLATDRNIPRVYNSFFISLVLELIGNGFVVILLTLCDYVKLNNTFCISLVLEFISNGFLVMLLTLCV